MSDLSRRVVSRFIQARYQPGDRVRIRETHNFKKYHGDEGEIEKIIPINKAYVELEKNGRVIVDLDDVEPAQGKTAAVDDRTKAVVKWLAPKRKGVIEKHLKAMSDELQDLMDQAGKQFDNDFDGQALHQELDRLERPIRERLQR